ncbi:DegT/DnrJ/EryC1/StrS family aminotransferase [Fibrobacterota bacterium]
MANIPFGKPIIGEEELQSVREVMESGVLAHGPKIHEFEKAFAGFTGAPYAVGVSSCTAALHLFYFHAGIGQGDEVIVPAQTHTATAHAVSLTGATPVFVDAEEETGNINIGHIEQAITGKTRAISVVHYLGMPVQMDKVTAIAEKRGLLVVEDCALSIGARINGVHTGLFGDAGCFSFYPVKHMTTAEGGALITRDPGLAKQITNKRAFGMDKHVGVRTVPGLYDIQGLGFNYRMNEMQAAIGVHQVARLPGFLAARKRNYKLLAERLRDSACSDHFRLLQSSGDGYESSYYCLTILLTGKAAERRDEILLALKNQNIGTSIYYPHPVPLMSYYREKFGFRPEDFPVAAMLSNTGVALSVGPHITEENIDTMVKALEVVIIESY